MKTDIEKLLKERSFALSYHGGTAVDDTIMDLVALAELAENDEKAAKELYDIEDMIGAVLLDARRRNEK